MISVHKLGTLENSIPEKKERHIRGGESAHETPDGVKKKFSII